jgi:hypothetical protein
MYEPGELEGAWLLYRWSGSLWVHYHEKYDLAMPWIVNKVKCEDLINDEAKWAPLVYLDTLTEEISLDEWTWKLWKRPTN